jgi:antitoxin (DNA-binding transcriptional repressor) of toxin-antitoxin stability system
MEKQISATELAKNLSNVLSRIQYRGERFVVLRNGEAVAILGPVQPAPGITVRELFDHLGRISRPHDRFADDLEEIQSRQGAAELPPWPS